MKKIILVAFLCIYTDVYAQNSTSGFCGPKDAQGNYGTNCQWSLDENQKLTITGTGAMGYHDYYDAPWGKDITEVSISGISSIPTHAFVVSPNLQKVEISDSVTSIGAYPFEGCAKLKNISLPESIKVIHEGIVAGTNVKTLILPESLFDSGSSISNLALTGSKITNLVCPDQKQTTCQTYLENALEYEDYNGSWPPPTKPLSISPAILSYTNDGDKIFYQNHWYNNTKDISAGNYIKKRIYSVDEANAVTGKTNKVRITYK
ncbi:MAG: leucine-rich repeat protein [Alphaproteobacteria bacterium]|nr:leucine-rich repeat protein [Alphaproteobacteria bacterium]